MKKKLVEKSEEKPFLPRIVGVGGEVELWNCGSGVTRG